LLLWHFDWAETSSGIHVQPCAPLTDLRSPEYRRFLALLRKAREEAKLPQHEVAAALKQPQSFVSRSESGERRVDFLELAAFARLYGKPLEYFVPPQDKKTS
jgi:hypothetical protein